MEGGSGMSQVVTSLISTLSANNLWAIVADTVPLIGIVTLFALGFWLVKRLIKKLSKAKGGQ